MITNQRRILVTGAAGRLGSTVAALFHDEGFPVRATDVVETWAHVLDLLERDPMECAELLD